MQVAIKLQSLVTRMKCFMVKSSQYILTISSAISEVCNYKQFTTALWVTQFCGARDNLGYYKKLKNFVNMVCKLNLSVFPSIWPGFGLQSQKISNCISSSLFFVLSTMMLKFVWNLANRSARNPYQNFFKHCNCGVLNFIYGTMFSLKKLLGTCFKQNKKVSNDTTV